MQKTAIEWTATPRPDGTLEPGYSANPLKYRRKSDGKVVWSCVKTSPGCAHCYSEAIALRFERGKLFTARNMEEVEPFLDEKELHRMLTYKPAAGKKCFVGDMTDVFGAWVPDELLDRLFAVMALRPDVTWQVLTKRAERMADYVGCRSRATYAAVALAAATLDAPRLVECIKAAAAKSDDPDFYRSSGEHAARWPLPNVWLGVSVEDQPRLARVDTLRRTPAAVRFLSCEPLLEDLGAVDLSGIGWVILGGESGPGARPCRLEWIRSVAQQCRAADVRCFVKQLGSRPFEMRQDPTYACEHEEERPLKLRDPKGGTPSQWPEPFPREFPAAPAQGA